MKYEIGIDESLVPACEAWTENQCESRTRDGKVGRTKYPRGFADVLQGDANVRVNEILKQATAENPALLPKAIKDVADEYTVLIAQVAAKKDAIVRARRVASGADLATVVLNEDPVVVEEPPIEKEPAPVEGLGGDVIRKP